MDSSSTANVAAYLKSWGLELAAKQNRVRQLIGDAHWLSDGHHKEAILREFLSRYLPPDVDCSTGFIRGATDEKGCSPEVDILLFNRRLHIPYFSEGGVSIIDPSCVLATIEVKSSFAAGPIDEAVKNIKAIRKILINSGRQSANLWTSIFFYDLPASRTMESAIETLGVRLKMEISGGDEGFMPTCVVMGQNCLAFPSARDELIRIRGFEAENIAFSSGICDLLALITAQVNGLRISGFDEWGASLAYRMIERDF